MAEIIITGDREVKAFKRRWEQAKARRKGIEKQWTKLTNFYHLKDEKYPTRYFMAFLADYADSIRARWINGIFAGRDFFGLRGRDPTDDNNAKIMQTVIKYQAEQEMNLIVKIKQMFISLSYLGTRIGLVGWDYSEGIKNQPFYRNLSNWDFWNDGTDNIEESGWCITGEKMTIGKLLELEKQGQVKDIQSLVNTAQANLKNSDPIGNEVLEKAVDINKNNESKQEDVADEDKELYICQMWTDNERITIEPISGKVIGTSNENPYANRKRLKKPIILWRALPEEGLLYAMSPVVRHIDLQEELNELRWDRRRKKDAIVQGLWLMLRNAGIDVERLRKNAISKGTDITDKAFRRLDIPNILPTLDNEEDRIGMYGDRHSGIYDPQRGGGEGKTTKTARGLELLVEEGNLLFKEQIANIHSGGLKDLIEHMVLLNQENLDEGKSVRITNKQMVANPDQLQGDFDTVFTSSPDLGSNEQEQLTLDRLQTKYAGSPMVKQDVVARKEWEAAGYDPDEILHTPEEINDITLLQQENEQLRQMVEQNIQTAEEPVKEQEPEGMV